MKGFNRTFKVHTLGDYKIVMVHMVDKMKRCLWWWDILCLERKGNRGLNKGFKPAMLNACKTVVVHSGREIERHS
jgi:hypothetical protein